jgi:hypothetical protein
MILKRLFVVLSVLAATVPWFGFNGSAADAAPPGWVVYSLLGTLGLIVLLECLILWFWNRGEGGRGE